MLSRGRTGRAAAARRERKSGRFFTDLAFPRQGRQMGRRPVTRAAHLGLCGEIERCDFYTGEDASDRGWGADAEDEGRPRSAHLAMCGSRHHCAQQESAGQHEQARPQLAFPTPWPEVAPRYDSVRQGRHRGRCTACQSPQGCLPPRHIQTIATQRTCIRGKLERCSRGASVLTSLAAITAAGSVPRMPARAAGQWPAPVPRGLVRGQKLLTPWL